jgi:hypothetical protein
MKKKKSGEKLKYIKSFKKQSPNMLSVARLVGYMPGGATPGAATGVITLRRVLVVQGAWLLLEVHQ